MAYSVIRILLIEPVEKQNKKISFQLKSLNHNVSVVHTIDEALKKMSRESPQIIICHKSIGEITGSKTMKAFHAVIDKNSVPLIMLFDNYDENDLIAAVQSGTDSFIFPFFGQKELDELLQNELQKWNRITSDNFQHLRFLFYKSGVNYIELNQEQIIYASHAFTKKILSEHYNPVPEGMALQELFVTGNSPENDQKLSDWLYGKTSATVLRSVPLRSNPSVKFNLYLTKMEFAISDTTGLGLVMPDETGLKKLEYPVSEKLKLRNRALNKLQADGVGDINLTKREMQVLHYSEKGTTVKEISRHLGISVRTVEKHRSNIIKKTNTSNIIEAIYVAQSILH